MTRLTLDGEPLPATDLPEALRAGDRWRVNGGSGLAVRRGDEVLVAYRGRTYRLTPPRRARADAPGVSDGRLLAPMPAVVVEVARAVGDAVAKGDRIAVLEAMKTQIPLLAPFDGTLTELSAVPGASVAEGAVVATVESSFPPNV